jgi:hypothetical protein
VAEVGEACRRDQAHIAGSDDGDAHSDLQETLGNSNGSQRAGWWARPNPPWLRWRGVSAGR